MSSIHDSEEYTDSVLMELGLKYNSYILSELVRGVAFCVPAEKRTAHTWPSQQPLGLSAEPCCLWSDPHRTERQNMKCWKCRLNYRCILKTETWIIYIPLSWTPWQCVWGDAGRSPLLPGRYRRWWTSPQKLPSGSPGLRYQMYLHPGHTQRYWKQTQVS